jgi:hypothetical protein
MTKTKVELLKDYNYRINTKQQKNSYETRNNTKYNDTKKHEK